MDLEYAAKVGESLNIPQVLLMVAVLWFFYSRLKAEIKETAFGLKVEIKESEFRLGEKINKLELRMEKLEGRMERLEGKFTELDKRIFGIESVLHMKECCVLKADSQLKKAE